jgi:hypothetical protein
MAGPATFERTHVPDAEWQHFIAVHDLRSADGDEYLRAQRDQADYLAAQIYESRMQQLRDGEFDAVPPPVDPLSTATRAVEARNTYGPESQQYKERRASLEADCLSLLEEAITKNSWGYFPEVAQEFDRDRGYLFYDHPLTEIVASGITPIAGPEESECRRKEFVEEYTYRAIGGAVLRGAMEADLSVWTASQCRDEIIEAYREREMRIARGEKVSPLNTGGHVPEIEKIMLRSVRFDGVTGRRYLTQFGLPGKFIKNHTFNRAFKILEVIPGSAELSKTEVQGTQIINKRGGNVLEFVELLDQLASQETGRNIFLGEEVDADHPKEYATVPEQARQRQRGVESESRALADYTMMLVEKDIDSYVADGQVRAFVQKRLFNLVKHDPERAARAFDKATADKLRLANGLRAAGDAEGAERVMYLAEAEAPPITYCGAGSCGLVAANLNSSKAQKARELGLSEEGLLEDTERSCPSCGEKTIMYDANASKACVSCEKTEIKG